MKSFKFKNFLQARFGMFDLGEKLIWESFQLQLVEVFDGLIYILPEKGYLDNREMGE